MFFFQHIFILMPARTCVCVWFMSFSILVLGKLFTSFDLMERLNLLERENTFHEWRIIAWSRNDERQPVNTSIHPPNKKWKLNY